ncbi:MAG: nucleotidyltransferase [Actinobacteria bacterium]|nr:nucleotidyltransferase [Actinomycetota bacterium]
MTSGSLTDALLAVHAVLAAAEISHALCGGLAANLYREDVRATVDVDVAVAVAPARVVDLVQKFEDEGWKVEAYWRQSEQLRLTRSDLPRVDCILATTDYERKAIDQAVPARIEGHELSVLTPEDLIVFKLIAGRARDYEAVAAIINAQGEKLEVDYITGWLEQFGVVERWERAREEARREAD